MHILNLIFQTIYSTQREVLMADKYHHGNLRQSLIDVGIKIITEQGEAALSLRKVAAECGVSHAAPYAHFQDKEDLLNAINSSVTEQFMEELKSAVENETVKSANNALLEMGKRYILFFKEHPDYFIFLFKNQGINAHLDMKESHPDDYAPYLMMRELFVNCLKELNLQMDEKQQEIELIKTWALVHGLASMCCIKGVVPSQNWEDMLDALLVNEELTSK